MPRPRGRVGYDGTTGRSDHGGRRTHIILLLRDSKVALSVAEVAERVGLHVNAARYHLEALVDAGLAERTQQDRETRGRPKILYMGTLPNQTHERAQGYRLLAEHLAAAMIDEVPDAPRVLSGVGRRWGRIITDPPPPGETYTEQEVLDRLIGKMDALWFAPEPPAAKTGAGDANTLVLHNCPFIETALIATDAVCALHLGMVNGTLAELGSTRRADGAEPLAGDHRCVVHLGVIDDSYDESTPVPLTHRSRPSPSGPRSSD